LNNKHKHVGKVSSSSGRGGGNRDILHIAVPAIVSNITVPLLGLVDVSVVGHLGAAAYIGAIAVGGMIFNVIYWTFGFLRMGTSGMTSQALGRKDMEEAARMLARSLGISLVIAMALIAMQRPIVRLALLLMSPTEETAALAATYFNICIWGAPAMLGMFSISGWFIGMQNSRVPMIVAIMQNVVNITTSLVLVIICGMKVEGVAFGTLTAQYGGFAMAAVYAWRCLSKEVFPRISADKGTGKSIVREDLRRWLATAWEKAAMERFFSVNRDIFLRTLCLVSVMLFFTSAGSWQGDLILAVNTLLMQMYMLFSYIMDGFAYAGEALCGKYYGARDRDKLLSTVRRLFVWGTAMSLIFTLLYAAGGESFLRLLTDEPDVVSMSDEYFYWALVMPAAGVAAFIWDGVFIGCTASRGMLISMFIATAAFFLLFFGLRDIYANHSLWLAFVVFLAVRGTAQGIIFKIKHPS